MTLGHRMARIPTSVKLLLILSAALLPIGAALVASVISGLREARSALRENADHEAQLVSDSISGLVARNALALRLASNSALKDGGANACDDARRTLAIAPGIAQSIELEDSEGQPLCANGDFSDLDRPPLTAPGDIRLWVAEDGQSVLLRTGVVGGSGTIRLPLAELRRAASLASNELDRVQIDDGRLSVVLSDRPPADAGATLHRSRDAIGNGRLTLITESRVRSMTVVEQLMTLLPVLMWVLAALLSWWLVNRLLIRPLRRLKRAVLEYHPGESAVLDLPAELGPAIEIRELGDAFLRAVTRIEEGEREMSQALEGQRRLVREVHHRVKNNLQVIASLLSIHGRVAQDAAARDAYAAIGRRVDALSVVHRNHFAELEDNQGIALRPMLTELASGLRASAPEEARGMSIELDLEQAMTTQDAAVASSFLVTEVVEFAMLRPDPTPVEISLRRTSELTARLTMVNDALLGDDDENPKRRQFDRIVEGLARQLRSSLERKMGRYSVDLPVFPPR